MLPILFTVTSLILIYISHPPIKLCTEYLFISLFNASPLIFTPIASVSRVSVYISNSIYYTYIPTTTLSSFMLSVHDTNTETNKRKHSPIKLDNKKKYVKRPLNRLTFSSKDMLNVSYSNWLLNRRLDSLQRDKTFLELERVCNM